MDNHRARIRGEEKGNRQIISKSERQSEERKSPGIVFLGIALAVATVAVLARVQGLDAGEIEVFFSPRGGASQAVASEIDKAEKEVLVATYAIDNTAIIESLIVAKKRGVSVKMIVDKGQEGQRYSQAEKLKKNGIETVTDDRHQLFHDKYVVIDGMTVITGSMNHTKSGESKNAENIVIIHDEEVAKKFATDWNEHRQHARAFKRKEKWNYPPPSPPENLIIPKKDAHMKENGQWHVFLVL
jgi:phosphatidylserine/phosphatidylglycerophosphate/cardiolipin synthase-like enzyme